MITLDQIVREGADILREKAVEVSIPPTDEDKENLEKMIMYLKNSQDEELADKYNLRAGVGLAAPQVGISKRMIAVHFTDDRDREYSYGLFNPKIVSHSVEKTYLPNGEGCLSVDRDVPGIVPRYARITVKATLLDGSEKKLRLKGYAAIVFQHEIDHLNGVMFYDYIDEENPMNPPTDATPLEDL
ncbi:peptide deformylase [Halalkalibacillus halophilus]|uniref:peptide deformylase n=1 Tax=Halalkalibacillus halophilus TaxID=392827 RepID=UPI0004062D62|nr:peptide deformylase [Halalkalibacillus halophilus]